MSNEGIKSQQRFLQDRGLYHGAIDGEWGNASIDAMKGWAYRSDSGNLDGSPFKNAPDGHVLVGDVIEPAPEVVDAEFTDTLKQLESKSAPVPLHPWAGSGAVPKKKKKKGTKAVTATPTATSSDGKKSFTVTGREGDKPQPIVKAATKAATKAVKPAAKKVTKVVKKAAKAVTKAKKPKTRK
jgi:hypothetical protein